MSGLPHVASLTNCWTSQTLHFYPKIRTPPMPSSFSEPSGTPLLPHQFITKIVHDADTGWGFVPLIGSGLSRPSGIITGYEFTNYLAFTTYLVLCDPATRKRTHGEGRTARWNLVLQGWPPQPNQQELTDARNWILQEFEGLCRRLHVEPNYDGTDKRRIKSLTVRTPVSPSQGLVSVLMHPIIPAILASEEQIPTDDRMRRFSMLLLKSHGMPQPATFAIEGLMSDFSRSHGQHIQDMGIRALHDWRETLQFLACTEVLREPDRLSFNSTANQSIIDAFNATITRDRHPNLAHKMLTHLAGGLRIHTILTTNFDTLTEDAFQQLSVRIRVLPVSSHGSLPNARTVAAEDTLVKLHGEAHDTRADLSLDDEPSAVDLETFADYLTRGGPYSTVDEKVESRRLLVMGYSGSDYRCVQMIKRWLESAADRPIIYWVCFSQNDVRRVQHLFRSEQYRGRLRITQTTRPDLLLYELYQRLHLSLPPGGLSYEFSHILPPRRNPDYESPEQSVSAVLECVRETKDLMEACRLIVGHQGRPEDIRALALDAMVASLSSRLVRILGATGESLKALTGPWRAIGADREAVCVLWEPWYRLADADKGHASTETPDPQFVPPVIIDAVGGVVRASAIAADKLSREQGLRVLWMEIVDYIDIDAMIRDFFRSLAHRFGVFQSQHVSLHPLSVPLLDYVRPNVKRARPKKSQGPEQLDWNRGVEAIARHLRSTLEAYRVDACQLRVMLYGRDGYGSSAGLLLSPWEDQDQIRGLHCFLEALAKVGVQVVYMPLLRWRAKIRQSRRLLPVESAGTQVTESQSPLHDAVIAKVRELSTPETADQAVATLSASSSVYLDNLKKVLHPFMRLALSSDGQLLAEPRRSAGRENAEKFIVFLYALCLFRHSRHPNALCSEATYQCPFRHNLGAVDNDFVRAEVTSVWIAQLRSAGLFLDKPGGASWMFGDLKSGMLAAIEKLSDIRHLYENPTVRGENRGHDRAVEMRARLHFWIGDWYQKAFCSSGHHVPILEAIHHQLMACRYAPLAKPKSRPRDASERPSGSQATKVSVYRHLLFLSALREACKTLRLAGPSLKLWQSSPFDVSWMNAGQREKLRADLQDSSAQLLNDAKECQIPEASQLRSYRLRAAAIRQFIDFLTAICDELTFEGGGARKDRGVLSSGGTDANLVQASGSTSRPRKDQLWKEIDSGNTEVSMLVEPLLGKSGADIFNAMQMVLQAAVSVPRGTPLTDGQSKIDPIELLSTAKAEWKEGYAENVKQVHGMIASLFDAAFVVLRRAKLMFHASGTVDRKLWLQSTIFCNLGIDFCKHLPASELRFDMDMRVRLHTVYSIGLANLGRFFEANRHLNEAQAILSKLEWSQPQEFAIICLRRAEVRLTECLWIAAVLPGIQVPSLQDNRATVAACQQSDMLAEAGNSLRIVSGAGLPHHTCLQSGYLKKLLGVEFAVNLDGDQQHPGISEASYRTVLHEAESVAGQYVFVPPRVSECLRKGGMSKHDGDSANCVPAAARQNLLRLYGATLDEAVSLLDEAEKLLRGNSQSALWWIRLYTLRLRVYGLLGPLGALAETCLIRRKYSVDQGIHENFINAIRIAGSDESRQLRAIRYFFEANEWYNGFVSKSAYSPGDQSQLPDTLLLARAAGKNLKAQLARRNAYKDSLVRQGLELLKQFPAAQVETW